MTIILGNVYMSRDKNIDAVAGLMIIVMVIGHCVATDYLKIFITLFNFYMP